MQFNNAVEEPEYCSMYAKLLCDLDSKLPPLPSEQQQPGGKEITVKTVLLNICHEFLQGADKRQMASYLGNIRFIGELLKQKLVPEWIIHHIVQELFEIAEHGDKNVEALCVFFSTVGKQLDESPKSSRLINDMYFNRLKELREKPKLTQWLRSKIDDVLDICAQITGSLLICVMLEWILVMFTAKKFLSLEMALCLFLMQTYGGVFATLVLWWMILA